ncbi:MAG: extracellular solute-binding protein, partial [Anaerolineae bacterium]|nr:extracellular solute-binding protein [Anaerolineae bacterium]
WFLQNGCSLYDPQTNTVPMDNDAAYEALQFQADMIHKHKVAPIPMAAADYEGPQKLFTAGRAAMILTGPWDTMPILQGNPNLDWGMAQALKRKVQATSAAGISVTIPKAAKYPDMAWELIKRLVTLETEIAATEESGMLMPRKSWAEHPKIQAMERVAPFAKALGYATFLAGELFWTGKSGEVSELFNKACEHAIYENRPASEVLHEFVVEANKVLQG